MVVREQVTLMECRTRYPGRPSGWVKARDLRGIRPGSRGMSSEVDLECRNRPIGKETTDSNIDRKNSKLRVQDLFYLSKGSWSGIVESTRGLWVTL